MNKQPPLLLSAFLYRHIFCVTRFKRITKHDKYFLIYAQAKKEYIELMAFLNIPLTHIDKIVIHPCVINFFIKVVNISFHDFTCRKSFESKIFTIISY